MRVILFIYTLSIILMFSCSTSKKVGEFSICNELFEIQDSIVETFYQSQMTLVAEGKYCDELFEQREEIRYIFSENEIEIRKGENAQKFSKKVFQTKIKGRFEYEIVFETAEGYNMLSISDKTMEGLFASLHFKKSLDNTRWKEIKKMVLRGAH